MSKMLETANLFLGNTTTIGTPKTTGSYALEKYEDMFKQGQMFNIRFDRVDQKGNFYHMDGNIAVIMRNKELSGYKYDLRYKSDKLAEEYCVMVQEISEEEGAVYVSHFAAKEKVRPEIEQEIQQKLEDGDYLRVKAKVNRIYSRVENEYRSDIGVWVDICGVGIPGYIHIGDWAKTYTPLLRDRVKYGDVIEVVIKEKRLRPKTQMVYYTCSRKELVDDPWLDPMLAQTYHVGDLVRITCMSIHPTYWFGSIKGISDIQIMGEYPSVDHKFAIIPGMEYMGKIYHIAPQEHSFKVRVFRALTQEDLSEEHRIE